MTISTFIHYCYINRINIIASDQYWRYFAKMAMKRDTWSMKIMQYIFTDIIRDRWSDESPKKDTRSLGNIYEQL